MVKSQKTKREASSFRDPSGCVYYRGKTVFRQVNRSYKKEFDLLFNSGLYEALVQQHNLLPHTRLAKSHSTSQNIYATLSTDTIPFISYPYEWTFSQFKDAALLTLQIQETALRHDMSLKDASCYNIQFFDGKPILIDLLSFQKYETGRPWIAYKQFCQHFLGPLLLMSIVDVRLNQLLKIHLDGIPLDLVGKLLPKRTLFSFSIASHIHFHAKKQQQFANSQKIYQTTRSLSKIALLGIIDSLKTTISKLSYRKKSTEWGEYYTFTNYSDRAFKQKKKLVEKYIQIAKPKTVWDIGANTGEFSRIASQQNIFTVSADLDPIAAEKNYLHVKKHQEKNILPLIIDLTNPSPAIGWANIERRSLIERGPADLVMVLALIHHLAISNNLPLNNIADFCHKIGTFLIIEFVPKEDSQVIRLLSQREDIFGEYSQKNFEKVFGQYFNLLKKKSIPGTKRFLYLMKRKK
jgi:ribosomal protein L11 methylase PrmA